MQRPESILIVGVGELGGLVLELLARVPGVSRIVVLDSNADWGLRKTNSAILGASSMGLFPSIEFHQLDLLDVDRTAELLAAVKPTIVYNATTLQSWWVVNELPPETSAKLYRDKCALGPWASMHLALTDKLMRAVVAAGIQTLVINSAYPDVTNASLARVGRAPEVGIGNLDLAVPYIQKAAAETLGIPMSDVRVVLVAHHYHAYYWCRTGTGAHVPHYLRVYVGCDDVTSQLGDPDVFIRRLPASAMRPAGRHGQFLVAASSVKNILAIYRDSGELTHAPGPAGLEGGYPVRLSRRGAEVVLPAEMSLEDVRAINLQAQVYDGVEEIDGDGDIVVTDEAYHVFRETLGIDCKRIPIDDAYARAVELRSNFRAFVRRHGVAAT